MAITQKSRWDDAGVEPPAGEAKYTAGEQPIAEYDNWFNKAVVDDIAALNSWLDNLGITKIYIDTEANMPASGTTKELFIATDTNKIYRGTGTGWQLLTTEWDAIMPIVKEEMVRYGLNIMALKAIAQAETKDFYSVVADYNNYKGTVDGIVGLDNNGGGFWSRNIRIAFDSAATEHAQYKVVIDANNIYVYSADETFKGQTGVGSFWDGVKSDGSDIRVVNQDLTTSTQRYFWIEKFDYTNKQAVIWVRVEYGDTELNIAYGNPSALTSAYNKLTQVFDACTDFEQTFDVFTPYGTSYEFNSQIVKNGQYSLRIYDAGEDAGAKYTFTVPSDKIIITEWVYITGNTTSYLFAFQDSAGKWIGPHVTVGRTVRPGSAGTPDTQIYYFSGNWVITGVYLTTNTWNKLTIVIDVVAQTWDLYLNDELVLSRKPFIANMGAGTSATYMIGLNGGATTTTGDIYFDAVYIPKLADPISISSIQHKPPLETINFDFPDGIDKVLITVDGDISQIEYSTDGGTTWNVIQSDTETLLPTTAYQIKFKFTGNLKGYAFLAW